MSNTIDIRVRARDTATRQLRSIGQTVASFAKGASIAFIGLGAAAGGIAAGISSLVRGTADAANDLLTLSAQTGLTVEQLQDLEAIAIGAGTKADTLAKGIGTLTQNLEQAETPGSKVAEALNELKIPITDINGQLRPMSELFPDIIQALKDVENPTRRAQIAGQLFGQRLALDMLPILQMSDEQVNTLIETMDRLAPKLAQDQVQALSDASVEWGLLRLGIRRAKEQIAVALLPVIKEMNEAIRGEVIPYLQELTRSFTDMDPVLKAAILDFARLSGTALVAVGKSLADLVFGPVAWVILGITKLIEAGKRLSKNWDEIKERVIGAIRSMASGATFGLSEIVIIAVQHWEAIRTKTSEIWGAIASFLNDTFQSILGWYANLNRRAGEIMADLWQKTKARVAGAWDLLSPAFGELFSHLLNWYTNLKVSARQWGRDMIQGFLDGIKSKAAAARDAISSAVGGVVNSAKDTLGIKSPSKVFAEIGRQSMAGLRRGIQTSVTGAEATVNTAMNAIIPSAPAAASGSGMTVHIGTLGPGVSAMDQRAFERMMDEWWRKVQRGIGG